MLLTLQISLQTQYLPSTSSTTPLAWHKLTHLSSSLASWVGYMEFHLWRHVLSQHEEECKNDKDITSPRKISLCLPCMRIMCLPYKILSLDLEHMINRVGERAFNMAWLKYRTFASNTWQK